MLVGKVQAGADHTNASKRLLFHHRRQCRQPGGMRHARAPHSSSPAGPAATGAALRRASSAVAASRRSRVRIRRASRRALRCDHSSSVARSRPFSSPCWRTRTCAPRQRPRQGARARRLTLHGTWGRRLSGGAHLELVRSGRALVERLPGGARLRLQRVALRGQRAQPARRGPVSARPVWVCGEPGEPPRSVQPGREGQRTRARARPGGAPDPRARRRQHWRRRLPPPCALAARMGPAASPAWGRAASAEPGA